MESNENLVLTFYNPKVPKVKGNRKYQRPTLPTNKHPSASMPLRRRQQHVSQTHTYIRMFCGSLSGFGLFMTLCMSPLSWVQLLVTKDGTELYAGLWTLCSHELCWTHTPKPPYFLQFSRAAFILSILTILVGLGWLLFSCLPRRGSVVANLDLKVSMLSFTSASCLLICLSLFLEHVNWHCKDVMEPDLLWTYYLNWWSDFLYTFAGIISFLNYISVMSIPSDEKASMPHPMEKSRLGIGPAMTEVPDDAKESGSSTEATHET
ncbi:transmembrane protein 202 [Ochotona princeps]|uniref:transmembrane protein 202 n=1 Tax=Ochotona princeps TaxID=9978 RepID=UPI0027152F0E|nr:transmembrane protein 202 [Ochotona princeps]